MESLEISKSKIKTGNTIKSLIRTMKVLASVNVKRYMKLLENSDYYDEIVKEGFAELAGIISEDEKNNLIKNNNVGNKCGYIIIGSDLGMCGQFNEKIIDFAETIIDKEKSFVAAAGERVVNTAEERNIALEKRIGLPKMTSGDTETTGEIFDLAFRWVFDEKVESVFCIYNAYSEKNGGYIPSLFRIFPIDENYFGESEKIEENKKRASFSRIDKAELLHGVVRNYFFIMLHKVLCESIASENSARLTAMKYAEKNMEEYMSELVMVYNEARQEMITSELLGIVGGYEVLAKKGRGR